MEDFMPAAAGIQFDDVYGKPILFGDFYVEDDYDVTRGVTLSSRDLYAEDDCDVTRGVTLPSSIDLDEYAKLDANKLGVRMEASSSIWASDISNFETGKGSTSQCCTSQGSTSQVSTSQDCLPSHEPEPFLSDDIAPALSQDIAEFLSLTTINLPNSSPISIGNKLLAFFRDVVNSQIDKVNRKKFTIRAKVFLSNMHCETKVRIYKDKHTCIAEFQRRAGDTIAFNRMFSLAREYLRSPGIAQVGAEIVPLLGFSMVSSPPDQALTPLFNIIDHSGDMNLLAEMASSLAEAAETPELVAQMRMPCALSALRELQQVTDFCVAYPTSQILARIH